MHFASKILHNLDNALKSGTRSSVKKIIKALCNRKIDQSKFLSSVFYNIHLVHIDSLNHSLITISNL